MNVPSPYAVRPAQSGDAATISCQREAMFLEMGQVYSEAVARFTAWASPRLASGAYLGWLVEAAGEVVAGAGLMILDWPPHTRDPQPLRGYLDNVYTHPGHRGRGLARALTEGAVAEARSRGIRVVTLHASDAGKPLYTALGFAPTNEMRLLVAERVPA